MSMIAPAPFPAAPSADARRQQRLRDALLLITDLLGDLRRLGYTDALADLQAVEVEIPSARTLREFLERRAVEDQPALPYLARRIAACLLDPVQDSTVVDVLASLAAIQHEQPGGQSNVASALALCNCDHDDPDPETHAQDCMYRLKVMR